MFPSLKEACVQNRTHNHFFWLSYGQQKHTGEKTRKKTIKIKTPPLKFQTIICPNYHHNQQILWDTAQPGMANVSFQ